MAVATTFWFLPRAHIDRNRWQSLTCAFQAMSSTSFVRPSCRAATVLPTRAGSR